MTVHQVFFIANGFQALDLFGPLDAFMETNTFVPNAYKASLLGLQKGTVKTVYGQQLQADLCLDDEFELDDLIICGGNGMRTLPVSVKQLAQLREVAVKAKRVFSICTGAFVLAKLFPDRPLTVTSHWRHCDDLARRSPGIDVQTEPLFVNSGNIWSSAGVLSGVDLALAIIRQDHGNAVAAKVAKELVVYVQRAGSQNQFSDMLQLQSGESFKLSPLLDWLAQHVDRPVSVSDMASFINLSERQVTRIFKQHLNCTPSAFFKQLKLNYARDLLGSENISVKHVAHRIGFNSYDSFRRAFYRQFSVSPSTFTKGIHS
ncbi:GlxA family transcriptional regulator [Aliidiomarina soli]|uniref:AraC family transcriptional regulator n=1 Tax=Aliidiomarina soli TaxID=1928574 RepID=A0A432WJA5_9GAMM|nr:helix-turn-helix domain-containing protein [Aliidiomarina soli]RUO33835.1 AraC family transcriptional regulator [Aliidiomarina soli]